MNLSEITSMEELDSFLEAAQKELDIFQHNKSNALFDLEKREDKVDQYSELLTKAASRIELATTILNGKTPGTYEYLQAANELSKANSALFDLQDQMRKNGELRVQELYFEDLCETARIGAANGYIATVNARKAELASANPAAA